jgi:hypothetical protein
MQKSEIITIVIQATIAIGTISAVIVAIWGDWIRAKLIPAKLKIEKHNFRGSITTQNDGKRAIYYHLIVKNRRSWIVSRNCRAMLVQIQKKGIDCSFHPVPLVIPLQLSWSPSEFIPIFTSINKEQVLDLGFVVEGETIFQPRMYYYSNNFQGSIKAGEVFRYYIDIFSDNFTSKKPYVAEIAWDGQWSDNLDEMANHLIIKEVG